MVKQVKAKQVKLAVFFTLSLALLATPLLASLEPCLCHSEMGQGHSSKASTPPCHSHKSPEGGLVNSNQHNCACHLDAPNEAKALEIAFHENLGFSNIPAWPQTETFFHKEIARAAAGPSVSFPDNGGSPLYLSTLRLRL